MFLVIAQNTSCFRDVTVDSDPQELMNPLILSMATYWDLLRGEKNPQPFGSIIKCRKGQGSQLSKSDRERGEKMPAKMNCFNNPKWLIM